MSETYQALTIDDILALSSQLAAIHESQVETTDPVWLYVLQTFENEVEKAISSNQQIQNDRNFALSFIDTVDIDMPVKEAELSLEGQCQRDHDMAERLQSEEEQNLFEYHHSSVEQELEPPFSKSKEISTPKIVHPDISSRYQVIASLATNVAWTMATTITQTSSTDTIEYLYNEEKLSYCVVCAEVSPSFRLLRCPCGHNHCIACLRNNIQFVQTNPFNFPPRCCEPITLEIIAQALSAKELTTYLIFHHEHELRFQKRCSNLKCGKGLLPDAIEHDLGFCVDCEQYTCTICRKPEHNGICPEGPGIKELFQTAESSGWAQCNKCLSIIERIDGCFHITCICGSQFCYLCFAPYAPSKTCSCAFSDEASLRGRFSMGIRKAKLNFTTKFPGVMINKRSKEMRDCKDQQNTRQVLRERARDVIEARKCLDSALHQMRLQKETERLVGEHISAIREEFKLENRQKEAQVSPSESFIRAEERDDIARRKLLEIIFRRYADKVGQRNKGKGRSSGYVIQNLVDIVQSMIDSI